jgi:hypothetical protein
MDSNDVLYTPIDTHPMPSVDVVNLNKWLKSNCSNLTQYKDFFTRANSKTGEQMVEDYPWDLTPVYFNVIDEGPGWLNNFNVRFPALSKYFYEALGLTLDDIGFIILLPVKTDYQGFGFWHNDPDYTGLRMYLDFEDMNNDKLYLKRTKIAYTNKILPKYTYPINHEIYLQPELIECKPISKNQCFYLNNFRSVHATYTHKAGSNRIAAFITSKAGKQQEMIKKVNDLIVRSALKFKDHSILWNY